jgi:hypothetical protein
MEKDKSRGNEKRPATYRYFRVLREAKMNSFDYFYCTNPLAVAIFVFSPVGA